MKNSSKKLCDRPLAGWGSGKLEQLAGRLSVGRIERDARALHSTERNYCYSEMIGSADHAASLLRGAGLEVTVTPLRADGVTTYLDYTMPQAWDVEDGRLEVVSPKTCADPVLADCRVDRFVIPNRCMATPPGGITAPLVHYDDRDIKGVRGKWVLIKTPAQTVKADMIARGAAGLVSFFSESGDTMQDSVWWHNGWSQGTGWYHSKAEPRIVMFSISCRRGKMLEALLQKGRQVVLKGFVKSRTYDGVIKTVSGLIPGKKKQEIVVLGHMYEPLADDNPAGNAAMIEMCRVINRQVRSGALPKPYYSIRILLSMERYGMGQFFADPARCRNVLAAICVDSIAMDQSKTGTLDILTAGPMAFPFFGDFVLEDMVARHSTHPFRRERGAFGDDTFMADPMIGVPITWYWCHEGGYHHNTNNTFDVLDWSNCLEKSGIVLRYIAALAWLDPEAARRRVPGVVAAVTKKLGLALDELRKHSREHGRVSIDRHIRFHTEVAIRQVASLARFGVKPAVLRKAGEQIEHHAAAWNARLGCVRPAPVRTDIDPLEWRAGNMIPKRLTRGLPFDNAKVPFPERKRFAFETERFVAWMDGRRNLWEVMQHFAIDRGIPVRPDEAKSLIEYTRYLARYGYLKLAHKTTVGKIDIKRGLRELGIRKGDRIMVHSSLSSMGHVRGGARAVIAALEEVVTGSGVVMMPSFNHGAPFREGPGYYDPRRTPTTNGVIADTFWRMPGVKRSLDPAHPFAVWGRDAASYVKRHGKVSTMGFGSPLQLLEEAGGKVILLGTGYAANTMRHVVEMTNAVKCLGVRTEEYPVKLPGGRTIKGRTWSWRAQNCQLMDDERWVETRMRERGLDMRVRIGDALVISFQMKDFRTVAEELLRDGLPGIPRCRDCGIGIGWTGTRDGKVKSDWVE